MLPRSPSVMSETLFCLKTVEWTTEYWRYGTHSMVLCSGILRTEQNMVPPALVRLFFRCFFFFAFYFSSIALTAVGASNKYERSKYEHLMEIVEHIFRHYDFHSATAIAPPSLHLFLDVQINSFSNKANSHLHQAEKNSIKVSIRSHPGVSRAKNYWTAKVFTLPGVQRKEWVWFICLKSHRWIFGGILKQVPGHRKQSLFTLSFFCTEIQ